MVAKRKERAVAVSVAVLIAISLAVFGVVMFRSVNLIVMTFLALVPATLAMAVVVLVVVDYQEFCEVGPEHLGYYEESFSEDLDSDQVYVHLDRLMYRNMMPREISFSFGEGMVAMMFHDKLLLTLENEQRNIKEIHVVNLRTGKNYECCPDDGNDRTCLFCFEDVLVARGSRAAFSAIWDALNDDAACCVEYFDVTDQYHTW